MRATKGSVRTGAVVAAIAASAVQSAAAIAAGAAKAPVPLASVGPWQVDYAPDACLLGRRYVDGKHEAVLGWRALPLEENVELILTQRTGNDRFRHGEAAVTLSSGAHEEARFESFPTTRPGYYSTRLRLPATMFAALTGDAVLTIDPDDSRPIAFALSGPAKAFAALATCNDDTLKTWGIDPTERQRVATPPEAVDDRAKWITSNDYPMGVVMTGRQGTTAVLFRIAATGRIDECRAVVTSGVKVLDDAACTALMKRGRYTPARDAAGQPMAVHSVRRIVWRLPGVWNVNR